MAVGIQFANGIELTPDERSVILVETGSYRIMRVAVAGHDVGDVDVVLDNLPGYPDNLTVGLDGRYWVGLVSSRRAIVDRLAPYPFLRKVVQRLPAFVRPEATRYGHVVAFTLDGRVQEDLQDPSGSFARTTGVLEQEDGLWITSLHEAELGWLSQDSLPSSNH